jgi:hypothetical protein
LLDAAEYTRKDLAQLYRDRWNIEVCQADCVSKDTLYRSREVAHSERCGVIGAGTMEPATPRNRARRTIMQRHIERPCPPPAQASCPALSA